MQDFVEIEATSNIREEGSNEVIFSIDPKNKEDALEKIRVALRIFLQLPNSPSFNSPQPLAIDVSFPIQKLVSQVQFLQSQLTLANATIKQKDSLIGQQSHFIQSQQFSSQILFDSVIKENENEEKIVGDLLRVKDFDWGPITLGLPELFRRIKKFLKKI